jgi:hypothetical protein
MKSFKELSEEINEELMDSRLVMLMRNGLVDKADISIFKAAFTKLSDDKPLTLEQKGIINKVFTKLVDIVINDKMIYRKIRKQVKE